MGATAPSMRYRVIVPSYPKPVQHMTWIANSDYVISDIQEESFKTVAAIGKGKFGYVFLAKVNGGHGEHVAIKYISKDFILETKSAQRILQEILVIKSLKHPFIVHYFGGFSTTACIGLIFQFAAGGELYTRMKKIHKMTEDEAKFYFCEIVAVLHYLHDEKDIVYRDLKPENILIDHNGHIKLCDFGFAVKHTHNTKKGGQLRDTCGTAMYIAPEVINGKANTYHSFPVDWWALGCILYEMVIGVAPFGDTENLSKFVIFNNIVSKPVEITKTLSPPIRAVMTSLLQKEQDVRGSWRQIRDAEWLRDIHWDDIQERRILPPWKPPCKSTVDTSNFLSWPTLHLPTATPNKKAVRYCAPLTKPSVLLRNDADDVSDAEQLESDYDDNEDDHDDADKEESESECSDHPKTIVVYPRRKVSNANSVNTNIIHSITPHGSNNNNNMSSSSTTTGNGRSPVSGALQSPNPNKKCISTIMNTATDRKQSNATAMKSNQGTREVPRKPSKRENLDKKFETSSERSAGRVRTKSITDKHGTVAATSTTTAVRKFSEPGSPLMSTHTVNRWRHDG
eukprot:gene8207-16879_t